MAWWVNQYYPPSAQVPTGSGFKRGANPFARTSQEPIDLLESITALELASCVPFIKIEKIDRLGKPATDVRPLMYDLIQGPKFGGTEQFGGDAESFIERSLVSLENLTVEFEQQYGQMIQREITISFTVHNPAVVFDRTSRNSWREILMDGKSFSLEYGWKADPGIVKNPLFNGDGHVTESGQILKSTQLVLLVVRTYSVQLLQTGEAKVVIKALENGDLALREVRFSDAFALSRGGVQAPPDDLDNVKALRALFNGLNRVPVKGKGEYYTMGDILDHVVAPMVTAAAKLWGYDGVDLLLGTFNRDAGPQADKFFGARLAGAGIEDFKVPADVIVEFTQKLMSRGRTIALNNFISMIINIMNGEGSWASPPVGKSYQKPHILLKTDTVMTDQGLRLIMVIHDVCVGSHPFGLSEGPHRLALDRQSKDEIRSKLRSLGVPMLEFTKAGSLITDANFQLQPDPLFQSIQNDAAYNDRKDRVQQSAMPDTMSRTGQARNGELKIPISILEGEIQMHGNFGMEVFGQFWIDFFGAKEISGVFTVRGKTDTLEAGVFRSSFKVISESIDPLNTRRRRTEDELKDKRPPPSKTNKGSKRKS